MATIDVLVPTYGRPHALAVTLAGLAGQTGLAFRVLVSSQDDEDEEWSGEVRAVAGILRAQGREVELVRHLPRLGVAEHRQFLLDRAAAPYALFLDDDVWLEPGVVGRLLTAIENERCGFVGSAPIGWSFIDDRRPDELSVELWDGPVVPEEIAPGGPGWQRHRLHNAANPVHAARELGLGPTEMRLYKVAWIGGCVLYDTAALREVGGFTFWHDLPPVHVGEDVLAQLRVMRRRGGAGILPSGAYHLELPTTLPVREADAPLLIRA
jgi:GT2 family glycosyltransferase